ncbi:MAG: Crp/Fnr family transcriptional regulator [Oscillospiraceae bacterium]|nr:Crp/Fnr family transcriptional regulator [Oscillospiraceae bacterium]
MGSGFTKQELLYLKKRFNARSAKFSKNETILHIDQDSNQVCFVLEGTAYLCAENEQCERSILRFFRIGEYFSASMLVPSEYAVSFITAKYPSEIVFFNREELFRFCAANHDWSVKFIRLLSEQGDKGISVSSFVLHQRSIRDRLTGFFRQEREIQGSDNIRIPIPYTDLADYLACDRSAMMKELSSMKNEGLIEGKNRDIHLCSLLTEE